MLKIPRTDTPRLLLKDVEVAFILGCSRRHVWELLAHGKICPPVHLGRLVRWRAADLDAWAANLIPTREVEPDAPRRQGRPRQRP